MHRNTSEGMVACSDAIRTWNEGTNQRRLGGKPTHADHVNGRLRVATSRRTVSQGDACAKLELSQKIFNFTVRETSRVGSKRTLQPHDGRWRRTRTKGVRSERRNERLHVRRDEAERHVLIDGGRSSATRRLAFEWDGRERHLHLHGWTWTCPMRARAGGPRFEDQSRIGRAATERVRADTREQLDVEHGGCRVRPKQDRFLSRSGRTGLDASRCDVHHPPASTTCECLQEDTSTYARLLLVR